MRSRRGFDSLRALLAVGILLGIGSAGTMANFKVSGAAEAGSFTTGSLDVRLDGKGNNVGQGGTWANANFAIDNLTPGESLAVSFPVRNDETTGFAYTATATAAGDLAPLLRFSTYTDGTAKNSGTAGSNNRSGSCTGTRATSALTLSGTAVTAISRAQTINPSASQNVCILVQLTSNAANSAQGDSAIANFAFVAVQS